MPGKDKTGPQGAGPMTGRHMGYCADDESQSRGPFGRGGRFGMGRGYGHGFQGNINANISESTSESTLGNVLNSLVDQISSLKKEIMELKNKN